ncbi:hypothetical protein B296_00002702 [Ensete ventricosum]|uniref:Uncharacterized protein n=1 Tax=Ensete ventricosum TaxID=4639 RepID=A0A426ZTF2_ENSVE|nr:hypothetical protein B296_00002702 [Ensete ventricosum]
MISYEVIQLTKVKLGSEGLMGQEDIEAAAGELDYSSAYIRLRESGMSEDKVEWTQRSAIVPQRRIYRSRRMGRRCKATDCSEWAWQRHGTRKGETSMESSIPCSHEGRALVVKGTEEMENAKVNSKYQDKAKGQRTRLKGRGQGTL